MSELKIKQLEKEVEDLKHTVGELEMLIGEMLGMKNDLVESSIELHNRMLIIEQAKKPNSLKLVVNEDDVKGGLS